jgi:hypothetical protein
LDAIRVKREYLIQQIRESERTIEQSRELIKRLDELLAKGGIMKSGTGPFPNAVVPFENSCWTSFGLLAGFEKHLPRR